jgi:hypothetical protein
LYKAFQNYDIEENLYSPLVGRTVSIVKYADGEYAMGICLPSGKHILWSNTFKKDETIAKFALL